MNSFGSESRKEPMGAFRLHSVNADSVSVDEVVDLLKYHGGVILRNLFSEEILQEVAQDIRPWVEKDESTSKTQLICSLPAKSRAFVERILGNQLYSDVCDILLNAHHEYWIGDKHHSSDVAPTFNAGIFFRTHPGNDIQSLHRDDMGLHNCQPRVSPGEYRVGRDALLGMFVADSPVTRENGATRFVPGSHLQATSERPDESQAVYAELRRGDAFFMLGTCYHGASKNITIDQVRQLYSVFMIKSTLRQVCFAHSCPLSPISPCIS